MGGRGRGRGAGKSMSLNLEALGIGRGGDAMPTAHQQPPPLFPALEQHPLPLEQSEKNNYLIVLKQDLHTFMEDSPYFVKRSDAKKDIFRYSDKYKNSANGSAADAGTILYYRMPEELRPKTAQSKKAKKMKKMKDLKSTIAALEKKETEAGSGDEADGAASDAGGNKSDDDEDDKEDIDEDAVLDEDDLEEDNDYCQEYFDNGEGFGADEDDNLDEGATY